MMFNPSGVPRFLLTVFACLILSVAAVHAGTVSNEKVTVTAPDTVSLTAGDTRNLTLTVTVQDGWHINAHEPIQDYLIPTRVAVNDTSVVLESVEYPAGKSFNFSFSNTRVLVYSGTVELPMVVSVPRSPQSEAPALSPGQHPVSFSFRYQACTDERCAAPEKLDFDVSFVVSAPGRAQADTESFDIGGTSGSVIGSGGGQNRIQAAFQEYGLILGLGFIFFLGLMLNLTPCVYPMIPITVGYFGGKEGDDFFRRMLDACMFIFGMALIYTIFGMLAGLTDNILGQALQQPSVLIVMSSIMVVLAASMFGVYELKVPASVRRGSEKIGQGLGTFGMGMTLGVAAAPCLAPATVTLMAYISQQQSAYMGGLLFFILSLGLGFPYVFLAIFASSLSDLPGSGRWLEWVNKLIGFMILGVAVYFLWPLMTLKVFGYFMIALAILAGLVLAVAHPPSSTNLYYARALCLAVLVVVFVGYANQSFLVAYEGIDWISAQELLETGQETLIQGPTLVYVSAEWCVPCKEMQIKTFPNNALRRELRSVTPVKIDLTNEPSPAVDAWLQENDVKGVPTMIFLRPNGQAIQSLRTVGFIGPSLLTNKVRRLKRRSRNP